MPHCGWCGKPGAQLYQSKQDKSMQVMACSPECAKRCAEIKVLKEGRDDEAQPMGGERSSGWNEKVAKRDAMRKTRMHEFMRAQVLGELAEGMYTLAVLIEMAPRTSWDADTVRKEVQKIQDLVEENRSILFNLPENKQIGVSIEGRDIKKQLKGVYKALGAMEKDLERAKRSIDDLNKVKGTLRALNERIDALAKKQASKVIAP